MLFLSHVQLVGNKYELNVFIAREVHKKQNVAFRKRFSLFPSKLSGVQLVICP